MWQHIDKIVKQSKNYKEINSIVKREIKKLETNLKEDSETLVTDQKYGFIAGALKETFVKETFENVSKSDIIDTFLTHKVFGFSDAEIQAAKYIVSLFEAKREEGITGFSDETYGFIDEPIYKGALIIVNNTAKL